MGDSPATNILIVDDEPDTCANLADILADLGYEVQTAHDGVTALEMVKKRPYDVALLDLRMPGMDGVELFRRIREISAETVAIIVTAYAAGDTAKSILAAGAWKILPKPVNTRDLLSLVAKALKLPLRGNLAFLPLGGRTAIAAATHVGSQPRLSRAPADDLVFGSLGLLRRGFGVFGCRIAASGQCRHGDRKGAGDQQHGCTH